MISHARDKVNEVIRNRVYLLDKDFDDLLGQIETYPGIYYLERFCIENYLLDSDAMVEVVVESHPKLKRDYVHNNLRIPEIRSRIFAELRELFSLFFLAQKENLGIPNCGEKPERFCRQGSFWEVDPQLVSAYREKVEEACARQGRTMPQGLEGDQRLEDFRSAGGDGVISGKFVAAMLFHYLKSNYGLGSVSFESFVYRLARKCNFDELTPVAERIAQDFGIARN